MKKLGSFFSLLIVISSLSATRAQTADDIINKYVNAIGGRDVLAKVKSIYLEGNATVMGNDYPTNTTVLAGKGSKNITTVNGTDIVQCFTDTGAWLINQFAGQPQPTALSPDAARAGQSALTIGGALVDFKSRGFTDSLAGRETIEGVNTYKIKLSQPGISFVYYIDPSTYYVLKTESHLTVDGKDETNTRVYSNFKKTDIGYVIPYTLGINNQGYDVTINYTKAEINKDVDPQIFAMPK
ncbi:MAG: hypothetical protein ABJA37_03915 [Ferruginibacter sp.]